MKKAVLISIHPEWCEKIASGEKTIEVRKTRPKIETPFKCYLYCTKPNTTDPLEYLEIHTDDKIHKANGKVIAEFICSRILPIKVEYSDVDSAVADNEFPYTGMTDKEIMEYLGNGKYGYGWCVTNLIVYDKPKELSEFAKPCYFNYDCGLCKAWDPLAQDCMKKHIKAPQSWCYVEVIK